MATVTLDHFECEEDALPPYCIVCGEATNEYWPVRRNFSYVPPWIWIFFIISWIIVVILYLLLRKRRKVWTPLCEDHRGYWTLRSWLTVLTLVAIILFIISLSVMATMNTPWQGFVATFVAFMISMTFFAVVSQRSVRAKSIDEEYITLVNVDPRFRSQVRAQRITPLPTTKLSSRLDDQS